MSHGVVCLLYVFLGEKLPLDFEKGEVRGLKESEVGGMWLGELTDRKGLTSSGVMISKIGRYLGKVYG